MDTSPDAVNAGSSYRRRQGRHDDKEPGMTTQQAYTFLDPATVERLSAGFHRVFESFDARADVFDPDAFFDLNMPVWRFQLQGATAFGSQIEAINQGPTRVDILRTVPTVSGFVTEHEEHQVVDGEDLSARRLWLCEVRDGRIVGVVGYCSGEWDEALRARHAAEAPMLRP
jgi:ketosteroid isomerase-like protein